MLIYEYLGEKDGELIYAYYPENNREAPGKVAITAKGKGRVLEESKKDFGKRYAYHAIHGIDLTRKTGTVAWY